MTDMADLFCGAYGAHAIHGYNEDMWDTRADGVMFNDRPSTRTSAVGHLASRRCERMFGRGDIGDWGLTTDGHVRAPRPLTRTSGHLVRHGRHDNAMYEDVLEDGVVHEWALQPPLVADDSTIRTAVAWANTLTV